MLLDFKISSMSILFIAIESGEYSHRFRDHLSYTHITEKSHVGGTKKV
jgi:hypothetical protein